MANRLNGSTKSNGSILQEVKYAPIATVEKKAPAPDTWFLYFTMITGILTWLMGATSVVWPSPAIVKMKSSDSNCNPIGRPITTVEISILLGTQGMIALLGSALLPKLADIIGRKRCLQVVSVGMFVFTIALAFSGRIELIILFHSIINSIFTGITAVFPMYITEVCEDHNRAKYGCLMALCLPLGQLYTFTIGTAFSYRTFTLLTAVPIIPFLCLFWFAPESPVYSLKKGRREECYKTLTKLRHNKSLEELQEDVKIMEYVAVKEEKKGFNLVKLFATKEGRIGIGLGLLPVLAQYLSGIAVIMPLMAPIFNESGSFLSGNSISIIVGIVKVVTFSFTIFVVERTGRKPLLVISSVGAGISLSLLGIYFYFKHANNPLVNQLGWLPLVCILSFIIAYALGLGPIPLATVSVFFPIELRSSAASFIITLTHFITAIDCAIFPLLAEAVGIHWCMGVFAITCFIGGFLIFMKMPETRGKSICEIQEILKNY